MNFMKEFKVLMLYPSPRGMSLVPPSLALFSALLKREGMSVDLFDTSFYKSDESDADSIKEKNLTVRPVKEKKFDYKKTDMYEDLCKKVSEYKPNIILVTTTETTFGFALRLLKAIDKFNILTVLGGVFPTFAPDKAINNSEIDIICRGEGEKTVVELCKALRDNKPYGEIRGIWVKQKDGSIKKNNIGPVVDINQNPLLDFSIFEERRLYRMMSGKIYKMLPVETHRGCPYVCTYCDSPSQNKLYKECTGTNFFRAKKIENVGREIKFFVEKWSPTYLFFWADTFFSYTNEEIDEFCKMYSEFNIPFYAQARPEVLTEYKIRKLKEVGLHRVGVGIEHGNEEYRRRMLKRYYTNEQAIEKLKILTRHNVQFSLNNIIGLPDETRKLIFDTIELNRMIKGADTASCSIFQPFHGTPLREYCIQKGYVSPDVISGHNSDQSLLTMPSITKQQISAL
jgi:anaerobic magnesium-protoporphyrin IX monomethyl ester cyclase